MDWHEDYNSDNDEKAIARRSLSDVSIQKRGIYPYNCIGKITIIWSNGIGQGTGFLISSTEILTVAHNIYQNRKQADPKNVKFKLFRKDDLMQNHKIRSISFHPRYSSFLNSTDNYVYDYALIKLQQPIKREKYLDVFLDLDQHFSHEQLRNMTLQLIGFPKDPSINLQEAKEGTANMKMTECSYSQSMLTQITQIFSYGCAEHQLPSEQGHSGSPILATINGKIVVVMIHKGGKEAGIQTSLNSEGNGQSMISNSKIEKTIYKNFGRIISSRLTELNGDLLYHLLEWSNKMNTEKSNNIFARSQQFSSLSLERMRKHTFWDSTSLHFNQFQIEQKKITYKSSCAKWGHLISKQKMFLQNSICLKNFNLPRSGTISFGFIHKNLKKNEQECSFDIYQPKSISFMITNSKNQMQGLVSFNGRIQKIENISLQEQIIMRLNCDKNPEVSRINRLQSKIYKQSDFMNCFSIERQRKLQSSFLKGEKPLIDPINLSNPEDNFDIEQGYYFYVSMCIPETSVQVDL